VSRSCRRRDPGRGERDRFDESSGWDVRLCRARPRFPPAFGLLPFLPPLWFSDSSNPSPFLLLSSSRSFIWLKSCPMLRFGFVLLR